MVRVESKDGLRTKIASLLRTFRQKRAKTGWRRKQLMARAVPTPNMFELLRVFIVNVANRCFMVCLLVKSACESAS